MRIKMLVPMAGPSTAWKKGDVVDVTEAEGKRLVARDFAEIEPEQLELETTVAKDPENAATRTKRPRRRRAKAK